MSFPFQSSMFSFSNPNTTAGGSSGIFSDDFTSDAGWTKTGTKINVNDTVSGKLAFNVACNGEDHRVHKSLGLTLSNTTWRAEFDFIASAWSGTQSLQLLGLVDTPGDMEFATQDLIAVFIDENEKLQIQHKNDATSIGTITTGGPSISLSTNYYIRLERTTSTNAKLSVFSDEARTSHITGSPINETISSGIQSLDNVQSSTYSQGTSTRTLTATIDNLVIYDTVI